MTDSPLIPLGPQIPRRGNAFSRGLFTLLLRLMGWRFTGVFPDVRKAVLIVAPHTSNQDGVLTVIGSFALGLRISFFVKHSAFRFPFGALMRFFGALPVDREKSKDLVGFSADKLREKDQLLLAVAPEGTRDTAENWKTGFYWIAQRAGVPVVCIAFDYATREIRLLGSLQPTGDIERELPQIIDRYRGITPRHPERLSGPLRALRDQPRP
ncbi:MAG: phospholipid/glycerol acyltransferase [Moraxellaceae bacterium]|jgi:1-acyl-sn-glycerol-3-phosphate acyltransferase|nr:phospholipid/glycerol acyltransferase [Moraxellaceae bacterium]